jgi:2-polyprenyl-3-methyl-5-hydroxy-6-metoxy-1,4-benzoquinol methylase
MPISETFDYGYYADCLRECYAKFGPINTRPLIKSVVGKVLEYYSEGNILDIGCGSEKAMKGQLNVSDDCYHSLDNDPQGYFTYRDVSEIPQGKEFSLVIANQFLEHIGLSNAIRIMHKIEQYLVPEGLVIATVPNVAHPIRQQGNIMHVTAWDCGSLYALFKNCNLEVLEIVRYSKRHPSGLMEKVIAYYVNRIYRIDWCDSVFIVGQKKQC